MKILNIGMNHKTAPIELREKLAYTPDTNKNILDFLINFSFIKEALYISTCNRVETIVVTDLEDKARKVVISYMCDIVNLSQDKILNFIYIFKDMDAVRHIFKVACSLDSMVVGEPQILGQVKEAYAEAVKHNSTGVIINSLMHRAFHVAKKVRTETGICESAVSVSYAAVELAEKIFDTLFHKKVLLIGAGEMAELTVKNLINKGVEEVVVANRTFERAVELASKFNFKPVSFKEIGNYLIEVDIVIASTASPDYIITKKQIKRIIKKRRNRPLFIIDIAVPRDVDPEINKLNNIYLYDIDDLKNVVQLNMEQRHHEAVKAERIIEEEVIKFERWIKTLAIVPTIISLKNKAELILQKELKRSESKLKNLTPEQMEAVQLLCKSIIDKLINDPILFLKTKVGRSTLNTYLDFTKRLFNLDQEIGEIYETKNSRRKLHN